MAFTIAIAAFMAVAAAIQGFISLYQPGWYRESLVRMRLSADDSDSAERARLIPLWRLRLEGVGFLVGALILAQIIMLALDELKRGHEAVGSALLNGLMGLVLVGVGVLLTVSGPRMIEQMRRQRSQTSASRWSLLWFGLMFVGIGAFSIWGAVASLLRGAG